MKIQNKNKGNIYQNINNKKIKKKKSNKNKYYFRLNKFILVLFLLFKIFILKNYIYEK